MSSPPHHPGSAPLGYDPSDDGFEAYRSWPPFGGSGSGSSGLNLADYYAPSSSSTSAAAAALLVEQQQQQAGAGPGAGGQKYPLSGASVYMLHVTDGTSKDGGGGGTTATDASTRHDDISAFVAALGGEIVPVPADATHALYIPSDGPNSSPRRPSSLATTPQLESEVVQCQAVNVPIVDVTWLERMSGLRSDEHWSEVDVGSYVPPIIAMIDQAGGSGSAGGEGGAGSGIGSDDVDVEFERMDVDGPDYAAAETAVGVPISVVDGGGSSSWGAEPLAAIKEEQERAAADSTTTGDAAGTKRPRRDKRHRWQHHPQSEKAKWGQRGRDAASRLGRSISETFAFLSKESPDLMEEDAVRRAMELSMLDCALVFKRGRSGSDGNNVTGASAGGSGNATRDGNKAGRAAATTTTPPHEILGVAKGSTPAQIKAAYRKLALKTHPDKGGSADEFFAVARAYRSLLDPSHDDADSSQGVVVSNLRTTAHWDSELQDHRRLVEDLFAHHGADLAINVARQTRALDRLGLVARDAGATNRNERNELISNSCFYLSLAYSYLRGIGALTCTDCDPNNDSGNVNDDNDDEDMGEDDTRALREADDALTGETALQLKRIIEAAVVKAHPEWLFFTLAAPRCCVHLLAQAQGEECAVSENCWGVTC